MPGRFGPSDFAACGRCGSGQVHPNLLVMGPIAGVDSDSRSYVCHACGHVGLPIFFDTESARAQFEREKKGIWEPEPASAKKGPVSIPILPIETDPLVDIKLLDLLPVRVATVTGVRWDAGALTPTGYRVWFQEYWDAIGGPRYNASRIYMLDLAGINRANPNFDVTRHLGKRYDVWLDSGGRGPEEVIAGFSLDVYVGGGLQESDVLRLGERGFAGGLVDPYTAVIRDLLNAPKPEAPTEAIAPAPAPRPASAPRSVPDSTGLP